MKTMGQLYHTFDVLSSKIVHNCQFDKEICSTWNNVLEKYYPALLFGNIYASNLFDWFWHIDPEVSQTLAKSFVLLYALGQLAQTGNLATNWQCRQDASSQG